MANEGLLNKIYQESFGRDVGKEGLDYWSGRIANDANVTAQNVGDYIRGGASGSDFAALKSRTTPAVAPTTYKPLGLVTSAEPEAVQKSGLGTAQSIANAQLGATQNMAPDVSMQMMNPATAQYYSRQALPQLQEIGGIGEQGYQAVQDALFAPIKQQDEIARQRLSDMYGGRGLYGSSGTGLMSGALAQQEQATQNALSNAVRQRYDLEMADRAARRGEALNLYKAGSSETLAGNEYAQGLMSFQKQQDQEQRDFRNSQIKAQADYINMQNQLKRAIDQQNFQDQLQLAGLGGSGAASANALQAQQNALKSQQDADWYKTIGTGVGSLLSLPTSDGGSIGGDILSSLWG